LSSGGRAAPLDIVPNPLQNSYSGVGQRTWASCVCRRIARLGLRKSNPCSVTAAMTWRATWLSCSGKTVQFLSRRCPRVATLNSVRPRSVIYKRADTLNGNPRRRTKSWGRCWRRSRSVAQLPFSPFHPTTRHSRLTPSQGLPPSAAVRLWPTQLREHIRSS
jgi:hypothetical protein